jgi:ABC-type amino acid transport substrate-binding protein
MGRMKRPSVSLLPLALGLLAALACAGGAPEPGPDGAPDAQPPAGTDGALARVKQRGTLVVAMDQGEGGAGTPPMYFPDAAGKPDGFDSEVARWIAAAVGVPDVRIVHGRYSELPELLRASREVDVLISGYAPTEQPGIRWSDSYLDYGLALVVRADSPVRSVADLQGQAVGIFDDDRARAVVKELVRGYGELVAMEDGYWEALQSGRIAGFLYDYPYAAAEVRAWYAAHPGQEGTFRFAQYNLGELHYAVGVREGEADLLAAVNQAVESFYASDRYGEAVRRHLSGGATVAIAAPPPGRRTVTVAPGETLSRIAARELGDAGRWRELFAANRDRLASPHLIEPGDVLLLPV